MLATAVFGLGLTAASAETINLTFASGYGSALAWTDEEVNTFLPAVNAKLEEMGSDNRIEWTVAVDGTLTTMANMLDAMASGLADVGHVAHVFEPVRLPLQNVASVVPFGTEDPAIATRALHELNLEIPAMQKAWEDLGIVYLTSFSFDSYLLVSRVPVETLADLEGVKVAAAAGNLPWLDNTGAIGVTGTSATIYNDIKSGVMDAAINSAMLAQPGKLHEVAPHIVKTGFGALNVFDVVVNKARWDALPEDVQQALSSAADDLQALMIERVKADTEAAFTAMEADGATVTELSDEQRVEWINRLPNIAERWVKDLEGKGLPAKEVLVAYLDKLREAGVDLPRDWADF
jgi:TRAP-type C4-dicarboxylate transport system substrate-binding protein